MWTESLVVNKTLFLRTFLQLLIFKGVFFFDNTIFENPINENTVD